MPALTIGAWVTLGRSLPLYFYEVDLGSDTQCFHPSVFVDVTDVEPLKRKACMAQRARAPTASTTAITSP